MFKVNFDFQNTEQSLNECRQACNQLARECEKVGRDRQLIVCNVDIGTLSGQNDNADAALAKAKQSLRTAQKLAEAVEAFEKSLEDLKPYEQLLQVALYLQDEMKTILQNANGTLEEYTERAAKLEAIAGVNKHAIEQLQAAANADLPSSLKTQQLLSDVQAKHNKYAKAVDSLQNKYRTRIDAWRQFNNETGMFAIQLTQHVTEFYVMCFLSACRHNAGFSDMLI